LCLFSEIFDEHGMDAEVIDCLLVEKSGRANFQVLSEHANSWGLQIPDETEKPVDITLQKVSKIMKNELLFMAMVVAKLYKYFLRACLV
jgi:hypothetical protein